MPKTSSKHEVLAFALPAILLALVVLAHSECSAQEGSLLAKQGGTQTAPDGTVVSNGQLTLENTSFIFRPLPPEAQRELSKRRYYHRARRLSHRDE